MLSHRFPCQPRRMLRFLRAQGNFIWWAIILARLCPINPPCSLSSSWFGEARCPLFGCQWAGSKPQTLLAMELFLPLSFALEEQSSLSVLSFHKVPLTTYLASPFIPSICPLLINLRPTSLARQQNLEIHETAASRTATHPCPFEQVSSLVKKRSIYMSTVQYIYIVLMEFGVLFLLLPDSLASFPVPPSLPLCLSVCFSSSPHSWPHPSALENKG